MAFIRCFLLAVFFTGASNAHGQTIYYPAKSSAMLKATAEDMAMLLKKAAIQNALTTAQYNNTPITGIILQYDSSISDNQACKVISDGKSKLLFSAAQDNGLCFGVYQYLQQLGFRFYQPGSIWEMVPSLNSIYKNIDTIFTCTYKYKSWFISGGVNRWVMDNDGSYGYYGENGHNWSLYQLRNNMKGAYGFAGHRADIMTGDYFTALKNNPCYVANSNGSRQATSQSVPDITNTASTNLWANTIEQKFTQYKTTIFSNTSLYINQYRNFNYTYGNIGLEVPDGARWGNSKENETCTAVDYPKESDQHFMLANITAAKIATKYPNQHFQLYAYSTHADIPSANITINKNIDVQLIPTVYQLESSTNGLRNRWYNRWGNISEYHYLNLSGWSGETPSINWNDLKTTLQIVKEKKAQGIVWEASPAKFGSLPYLLAANSNLKDGIPVDSTIKEFCKNMFGSAFNSIYIMLLQWGDEKTAPDKYKLQLYLQLMKTAVQQASQDDDKVQQRLRELKAYLHYMVLYYDLTNNDQFKIPKAHKEAAICIYLAKTNKMLLVNSYYLIALMVNKYATTTDFYKQYNITNGTQYQQGKIPLLTAQEIDSNFANDLDKYGGKIDAYKFDEATNIKTQFVKHNLIPLEKIDTKITYTNGMNYYNKTSFHIIAPAAGNFTIQYIPHFEMPGKGYINFLVEGSGNGLQVISDISIDNKSGAGSFTVQLPAAGKYILSIVSKYKSAVDISILTGGNYFYKNGPFLGHKTENYRNDLQSLPGYFYIPAGITKLYMHATNNFSGNAFATAAQVSKTLDIKNKNGTVIQLRSVTPKDSSLFYAEVPDNTAGTFWRVTKMAQYNLQFVNISNVLWYAKTKPCSTPSFTIEVISRKGKCITQLATANSESIVWDIYDNGRRLQFSNTAIVQLPDDISASAAITLTKTGGCSITKILGDNEHYSRSKEDCSKGTGTREMMLLSPFISPNPSTGTFNCMQDGNGTTAEEVVIFNTLGAKVGHFRNVKQFDLSNTGAGLLIYQMKINGIMYQGKLVKL